jgi:hypothetical protein
MSSLFCLVLPSFILPFIVHLLVSLFRTAVLLIYCANFHGNKIQIKHRSVQQIFEQYADIEIQFLSYILKSDSLRSTGQHITSCLELVTGLLCDWQVIVAIATSSLPVRFMSSDT